MSRNTEIITSPTMVPILEMEAAEAAPPPNLLRQVHMLLRGRYRLAAVLVLIGTVAGAWIGHEMKEPLYQSTGLVRVRPYIPRILYESEQSGVMPMFDAFVGSQVELMKSERVANLAMQDAEWAALGRGLAPAQVVSFRSSLNVARPKGSEMILVTFDDRDPEAARLAVKAVITAYQRLHAEAGGEAVAETIRILEDRSAMLAADLKALNDSIFAINNEQATGTLEKIYDHKLSELQTLESELRRVELEVAIARGATAAMDAGEPIPIDSPESLALHVPDIRNLLDHRRMLERQLLIDGERLGPEHQRITGLKSQIRAVNDQIDESVEIYRRLGFANSAPIINGAGAMSLAQVEARERNIRTLYERLERETRELGRKTVQLNGFKTEADEKKSSLAETKKRLETLTLEQNLGGRIIVESTGDRPLAPAIDKRKQFAAAGAMGLGGAGLGLVLLLGLIDRRVRGIADIEAGISRTRLLGVLPQLPKDVSDQDQALMAAHSVHQIRTSLVGRHREEAKQVFAITSPSPDSGKTSLSLALGLSFAASRSRTLLIDCDFVGGGLTSKMKMITRRRLGHILRREGVITTPQLVEALKIRARDRSRLGDVLVALGYATQREVDDALEVQRQSLVGLREAMLGDPPQECFAETGTPGLYVMPLGSAGPQHVGELSYPVLRGVVEQVRRWFDVIIIDTGPILGSLEASIAALVADEVVLTVARGEERGKVQRSLEQLSQTGASVAGVVLNRAEVPDIVASGYSSSVSRRSGETENLPDQLSLVDHKNLRLGPIGSAVAALAASPARETFE